ncbi:hypothetical protein GXP67_13345 [Rhodocytophaga rosea]|uniref:DUF5009 domain-containing protein n=1 Tax=Rhodocytophaga rosea TaxID=2704465 RepID=A0A6C0GIJ4_9BACT|nr:hypothetical protein [Rhodocytophaga rosea]QHT67540.1 hypothetical protein GXP67_13345 [Rhodocytophaga rosea]
MTNPVQELQSVKLQETHPSGRLISLDAMRGFTIAAMILVNFPGSEYIFELPEHDAWHGLTPTDLSVFPVYSRGFDCSGILNVWKIVCQQEICIKRLFSVR